MKKIYFSIALALAAMTGINAQNTVIDFTGTGYTTDGALGDHSDWTAYDNNDWAIDEAADEVTVTWNNWEQVVNTTNIKLAGSTGSITSIVNLRFALNGGGTISSFDEDRALSFYTGFKTNSTGSSQDDRMVVQLATTSSNLTLKRQGNDSSNAAKAFSSEPTITTATPGAWYQIIVEITIAATAAESSISARIRNNTTNENSGMITQTDIDPELFAAAKSDGAGIYYYMFAGQYITTLIKDLHVSSVEFGTTSVLSTGSTAGIEFGISPNPASDVLNVSGDVDSVDVIDLVGNTVISGAGTSVDVSGLASGVYIVKASSANGTGTKKFVKQ